MDLLFLATQAASHLEREELEPAAASLRDFALHPGPPGGEAWLEAWRLIVEGAVPGAGELPLEFPDAPPLLRWMALKLALARQNPGPSGLLAMQEEALGEAERTGYPGLVALSLLHVANGRLHQGDAGIRDAATMAAQASALALEAANLPLAQRAWSLRLQALPEGEEGQAAVLEVIQTFADSHPAPGTPGWWPHWQTFAPLFHREAAVQALAGLPAQGPPMTRWMILHLQALSQDPPGGREANQEAALAAARNLALPGLLALTLFHTAQDLGSRCDLGNPEDAGEVEALLAEAETLAGEAGLTSLRLQAAILGLRLLPDPSGAPAEVRLEAISEGIRTLPAGSRDRYVCWDALLEANGLTQALYLAREALETERGRTSPGAFRHLVDALNDVCRCLDALGRCQETLPLEEEALALLLSPGSRPLLEARPQLLRVHLGNMALTLAMLDRPGEALLRLAQAYEADWNRGKRAFSLEHEDVAEAVFRALPEGFDLGPMIRWVLDREDPAQALYILNHLQSAIPFRHSGECHPLDDDPTDTRAPKAAFLAQVLDALEASRHPSLRSQVLEAMGWCIVDPEVRAAHDREIEAGTEIPPLAKARALHSQTTQALGAGDLKDATACAERCLALLETCGEEDDEEEAQNLRIDLVTDLASHLLKRGDLDLARNRVLNLLERVDTFVPFQRDLALERLRDLADAFGAPCDLRPAWASWQIWLAKAALERGIPVLGEEILTRFAWALDDRLALDEVGTWVCRVEAEARLQAFPALEAWALHLQAHALLYRFDTEEALAMQERALACQRAAEPTPSPFGSWQRTTGILLGQLARIQEKL